MGSTDKIKSIGASNNEFDKNKNKSKSKSKRRSGRMTVSSDDEDDDDDESEGEGGSGSKSKNTNTSNGIKQQEQCAYSAMEQLLLISLFRPDRLTALTMYVLLQQLQIQSIIPSYSLE